MPACELPESVSAQLTLMGIQSQQVAMADLNLAFARQRDGAAFDQRTLGAVAASELLVSNDAGDVARMNTAIRTPTTIDHPSAIVGGK